MTFPFAVGNAELQDKLEWVAQPPPAQGRDTHALLFTLRDVHTTTPLGAGLMYRGTMFFRPQGTGSGLVGGTPGLDGIGYLEANDQSCRQIFAVAQPDPPRFVKVFIGFRRRASAPAAVFATLQLLEDVLPDRPPSGHPEGQIVEFSNVNVGPNATIDMDLPEGWRLFLSKTTVLLRSP